MHKHLFIAGLHKSGTSILAKYSSQHPDVSSFRETGYPKDEGQFLQTVYPKAYEYGGPGKFGLNKEMHLTEISKLLTDTNKNKLINEWNKHWDLSKKVLLEKSPPNILKSRFLQAIFPESYFVFIMRHPIAVAYSTQQWSKTSIFELVEHWIFCHEVMQEDIKHLKNYLIIKFEHFVKHPEVITDKIHEQLNISKIPTNLKIDKNTNEKYFMEWQKLLVTTDEESQKNVRSIFKHEKKINGFGYSLIDCQKVE